jgi:hypothetical protein
MGFSMSSSPVSSSFLPPRQTTSALLQGDNDGPPPPAYSSASNAATERTVDATGRARDAAPAPVANPHGAMVAEVMARQNPARTTGRRPLDPRQERWGDAALDRAARSLDVAAPTLTRQVLKYFPPAAIITGPLWDLPKAGIFGTIGAIAKTRGGLMNAMDLALHPTQRRAKEQMRDDVLNGFKDLAHVLNHLNIIDYASLDREIGAGAGPRYVALELLVTALRSSYGSADGVKLATGQSLERGDAPKAVRAEFDLVEALKRKVILHDLVAGPSADDVVAAIDRWVPVLKWHLDGAQGGGAALSEREAAICADLVASLQTIEATLVQNKTFKKLVAPGLQEQVYRAALEHHRARLDAGQAPNRR